MLGTECVFRKVETTVGFITTDVQCTASYRMRLNVSATFEGIEVIRLEVRSRSEPYIYENEREVGPIHFVESLD